MISSKPVYAELVEALSFSSGLGAAPQEQEQPFDKLRVDGVLLVVGQQFVRNIT
jgi:hypothetical protein